jgi:hypothetical protein
MSTLQHRNGGTIESVTAIAHETYKGVADWFFTGRVRWADGGVSESARIAPFQLCHDDSEESRALVHDYLARLTRYLDAHGEWHEPKHKRDGRVYSWTPHKPNDSEPQS